MDIEIKVKESRFNYRVGAIILNNNKILFMKDGKGDYYYLPGGRVKLHETSEEAIKREIKEELKIDVEIERPLWLVENFFVEDVKKEKHHELGIYFLINIKDNGITKKNKFIVYENNNKKLEYTWLSFESLKNEYLYPEFIKERIFNLPKTMELIVEKEENGEYI
ncbi:NUDIX hydrolase [Miniphocaeibacter halophilus]|uniref:NUDIX domain-containing protein n=1 Tax=Miniphocaeibacter halophilus TaxID=2931922 RepID=A0AC61MMQ7_9FIRM|nr:NUDIX domain-containing protein [Miniphocaeibacter halophilus]QQK06887.1 NUDIX domain-containing protein [Miniphocaeibacter halophilus]